MDRIGIRELPNRVRRIVRRAMAGERIVITLNGVPAAQLGPLNAGAGAASLDDLVAAGLLRRPRTTGPPAHAAPAAAPPGPTTTELLRRHRHR